MIILDTDVLIEIFDKESTKGDIAIEKIEEIGEDIAVTSISLHEIQYGIYKYGKKRISASEIHRLTFGENIIDLTDLEQLVGLSQTKAIGFALDYARKYMDGEKTLKEIVTPSLVTVVRFRVLFTLKGVMNMKTVLTIKIVTNTQISTICFLEIKFRFII